MVRRQQTGVEVEKEESGVDPTRIRLRFKKRLRAPNPLDCKLSILIDYAEWEESQNELGHARYLWKRALAIHTNNSLAWSECAKFYRRIRNYLEAKRILELGVSVFPDCEPLWNLYIKTEEEKGGVEAARKIFVRWIDQSPVNGSYAYLFFLLKHKDEDYVDKAREVYEKLVERVPSIFNWTRYASFETGLGEISKAQNVYDRAMHAFRDDPTTVRLIKCYSKSKLEAASAIVPPTPPPASPPKEEEEEGDKDKEERSDDVQEGRKPMVLKLVMPPWYNVLVLKKTSTCTSI